MQAQDFVRKWQAGAAASELNERAGAQAHFIDLCRVLGVPEPADPDAYCFERGVTKTGSAAVLGKQRTDGFADVWLRGHFAWEYKAPGKSLEGALRQLMMYASAFSPKTWGYCPSVCSNAWWACKPRPTNCASN